MSEQHMGKPYIKLGALVRTMREQRKETLAEVSGAVEIDTDVLERIESGEQRPSEDILLLLLSYFDIQDEDSSQFWDLAGYGDKAEPTQHSSFDLNHPVAMLMPVDLRVVYTDRVHVMANNFGVVMNFMQTSGPNGQPLAVSRIGMSREHAQSVVELLQDTLKKQRQTPLQLQDDNHPRPKKQQKE